MRAAAAVLLAALSVACTEPDVPKYDLSPVRPTVQVPTTLTIKALPGAGSDAKTAVITASLKDQDLRGIESRLLTFATSKGSLQPSQTLTNASGDARTTVTSGTATTVTVSGAGLQAATDVAIDAPLSVSLSLPMPEKNVPVKITATVITADAAAPLSFAWNFGDGQTATTDSATITHQYRDDGRVTLAVTVTDALERVGSTSASVFVRDNVDPPPPPTPTAPAILVTVSATSPAVAGQPVTLTATATPQNGAPSATSFEWDCLDDGVFESTTPVNTFVCTYPAAGARTARVRAQGGTVTGEGTVAITVLADAPLLLSVTANPLVGIVIGTNVTFTATVTSIGPVPPGALRWEWDDNGDGVYDFVVSSAPSPNLRALMFGSVGPKTVKVRVTHPASSREALGTVTITVN